MGAALIDSAASVNRESSMRRSVSKAAKRSRKLVVRSGRILTSASVIARACSIASSGSSQVVLAVPV